jgi:hypothetical protein
MFTISCKLGSRHSCNFIRFISIGVTWIWSQGSRIRRDRERSLLMHLELGISWKHLMQSTRIWYVIKVLVFNETYPCHKGLVVRYQLADCWWEAQATTPKPYTSLFSVNVPGDTQKKSFRFVCGYHMQCFYAWAIHVGILLWWLSCGCQGKECSPSIKYSGAIYPKVPCTSTLSFNKPLSSRATAKPKLDTWTP